MIMVSALIFGFLVATLILLGIIAWLSTRHDYPRLDARYVLFDGVVVDLGPAEPASAWTDEDDRLLWHHIRRVTPS